MARSKKLAHQAAACNFENFEYAHDMCENQTHCIPKKYDVIIVGLGPVGTTLASLLGLRGVNVLGVDPTFEPFDKPRAIGIDHEAMRVFQQIGVADAIADAVGFYSSSEYRTADGEVIRRFESQEPPFPLSWAPYLTFLQPNLERALRARAATFGNVELRYGVEAVELVDSEGGPRITLRETLTGAEVSASARYVVGCDGGNSFVRKAIGIGFEDLDFDEPWLVVDTLVNDGPAPPRLPEVNVQFCDPRRPHTFVICAQKLRRWEFMIMPGENVTDMARPETVWRLLSPYLSPEEATLWRAATYRFHALVARQWRKGNVLLAGDACHMTPPFLAQGMVQGIKDAANLAWKLAAVCGGAPSNLLDTYETERRPHVLEVIRTTKELGRIIGEVNPERATERNARMREAMASGLGVTVRQNLFPPLRGGAFLEPGERESGVGTPAPQPWIKRADAAVRLDEITGAHARIVALPSFAFDRGTRELAEEMNLAIYEIANADSAPTGMLIEQDDVVHNWMAAHGIQAILVRPDHYVFAGVRRSEDLEAALKAYGAWLPTPIKDRDDAIPEGQRG